MINALKTFCGGRLSYKENVGAHDMLFMLASHDLSSSSLALAKIFK